MDAEIRKYAVKTVLWGCSVDEKALTDEIKKDIVRFDLITARESLSYNYLRELNPNTVKVADPAFLLEREDLPLPEHFIEGRTIGINISPMIFDYAGAENCLYDNYKFLIRFILKETDMNVCLIPHVVWSYNNDYEVIKKLYCEYSNSERVSYVRDGNCKQLKGYIARCRFFIGARTHATIAAYSSNVPTLAVGYSIKSKGIATDLFGTDEGYVLPVDRMNESGMLVEQCKWLFDTGDNQKGILEKIIPEYKKAAESSANHFNEIIRCYEA